MHHWLEYFRHNAVRELSLAGADLDALAAPVRRELARSLGRFYLGEAGEGRIIHEARASANPAFAPVVAESIAMYIGEEWRHAREVKSVLDRLGAPLHCRTWSERLFRRGRRLLGLRLKLLTIGAAEVAGVVYYSMLATHVPAASLARMAARIADEESRHLRFVIEAFDRATSLHPRVVPTVDRIAVAAAFVAIAACGAGIVALDHGRLLRTLGVSRAEFLARCAGALIDAMRDHGTSGAPSHACRPDAFSVSMAPAAYVVSHS